MKIPKLINNIFSVNKTCLLFFHNKHAFGRELHTNLNIHCVFFMQAYTVERYLRYYHGQSDVFYLSVFTYSLSIVAGQN